MEIADLSLFHSLILCHTDRERSHKESHTLNLNHTPLLCYAQHIVLQSSLFMLPCSPSHLMSLANQHTLLNQGSNPDPEVGTHERAGYIIPTFCDKNCTKVLKVCSMLLKVCSILLKVCLILFNACSMLLNVCSMLFNTTQCNSIFTPNYSKFAQCYLMLFKVYAILCSMLSKVYAMLINACSIHLMSIQSFMVFLYHLHY